MTSALLDPEKYLSQVHSRAGTYTLHKHESAPKPRIGDFFKIGRKSRPKKKSQSLELHIDFNWNFTPESRQPLYRGTYIDDLIAIIPGSTGGSPVYAHCDRQYNVRGLTDSSGDIVELCSYTPYGTKECTDDVGTAIASSTVYGFTGRRFDEETGLWYFRARYFDEEMGRFISRDPLGYVDGYSLYTGYFAEAFAMDPSGTVRKIVTHKTKKGTITINLREWVSPRRAMTHYMTSEISFEPSDKCECQSIKAIQVVRHSKNGRTVYDDDWASKAGWQLDILSETKGSKVSPYYADMTTKYKGSDYGENYEKGKNKGATIKDLPELKRSAHQFVAMTCFRCIDTGEDLGCVHWGFKYKTDKDGEAIDGSVEYIAPASTTMPQQKFKDALKAAEAYYHVKY